MAERGHDKKVPTLGLTTKRRQPPGEAINVTAANYLRANVKVYISYIIFIEMLPDCFYLGKSSDCTTYLQ